MGYTVYMHKCPNDKIYIGITSKTNVKERWRNGREYNNYFKKAIKKYGWEKIQHIILYTDLSEEEAKNKEIELISTYNSANPKYGYNLSTGGETSKGYKHTKEQIEKQKRNRRNRKEIIYSKEILDKMSYSAKKVWEREGYKEKMSKIHKELYNSGKQIPANKGKKQSSETINKIKQTRKVKYILCIENGEIYRGSREVKEKLNIDRRTVMRILHKEKGFKSSKGYHFQYIEAVT